jgi:hypothetical protein
MYHALGTLTSYAHGNKDVRQSGMHTAVSSVTKPSPFRVEITTGNLKGYKQSRIQQMIQAGG